MALLGVDIDKDRVLLESALQVQDHVEVVGLAAGVGALADLMEKLGKSPYLTDVAAIQIKPGKKGKLTTQFKVAFTIREPSVRIHFGK